jgi:hypothetical protein
LSGVLSGISNSADNPFRAGRGWARIVLTILVVLNVLSLFNNEGTMGVEYVGTALSVIATVLSYLPASNAYIKASKARA